MWQLVVILIGGGLLLGMGLGWWLRSKRDALSATRPRWARERLERLLELVGGIVRDVQQHRNRLEETSQELGAIPTQDSQAQKAVLSILAELVDMNHRFLERLDSAETELEVESEQLASHDRLTRYDRQSDAPRRATVPEDQLTEAEMRLIAGGRQGSGAVPSFAPDLGTAGRSGERPARTERRQHERRPYSQVQWIAPYAGGRPPDQSMFKEVKCHDVSAGGFSYLLAEPPLYDSLVVELGAKPDSIYLTASVVRHEQVAWGKTPLFLVGCRFTGRVAY